MKIARAGGFTLIEMMMALVVLAVLLIISAPTFRQQILDNRILSELYAMRAALNKARSEALAQRAFVTFCQSDDGLSCSESDWKEGYIAFRDMDGDGAIDDPNDPDGDQVFFSRQIDSSSLSSLTFSNGSRVRFDSRGYAQNFEGTFTFCDERGATKARGLIVTPGGLVRAADDPNDVGVVLDLGGNQLVCP